MNTIKIFSPSLLVCLNYIIVNNEENIFNQNDWNIFNLKNM